MSLLLLPGHILDVLARVPLWKDGLDYRHGTGHGIGSYLNVHEGNVNYCIVSKSEDSKFSLQQTSVKLSQNACHL